MTERRRARRRSLPYLRSAVLETGARNHIVTVTDLSPEGAFLATRIAVATERPLRLRMVLPGDGREVVLPCEAVRQSERFDAKTGRAAGLAVRFRGLDPDVARRVEECSGERLPPAGDRASADRFEYRFLDRAEVALEELSQLGLDGWRLAAALPSGKGVRLILFRRL